MCNKTFSRFDRQTSQADIVPLKVIACATEKIQIEVSLLGMTNRLIATRALKIGTS